MAGPKSKTQAAVEELGKEILDGRYPEGEALPTEYELCERFDVSRMTVRVILSRLEQKGLIYRQQGRGTFACPRDKAAVKPMVLLLRDLGKATSPYMTELVRGANSYLMPLGSHVSIVGTRPRDWSPAFCRSVSGVIVIPVLVEDGDLAYLREQSVPCLVAMESELSGPAVTMGVRTAAEELTEELLRMGHRRFALITGHRRHTDLEKRLGIQRALTDAGILVADVVDHETDYRSEAAEAAASAILDSTPRPTAVICFDDTLALQMISSAQQRGLNIPEDLSVSGFNDASFSSLVTPSISTVRLPVEAAGVAAAQALHEAGLGQEPAADIALEYELVWRDSTGPVPTES